MIEYMDYIQFFFLGMIITMILDVFRGHRLLRSRYNIVIYDILFCLISFIVISLYIIYFLDTNFRIYLVISILLGSYIYIKFLSKYFINIVYNFFVINSRIISFIFLNFSLLLHFFVEINKILKKFAKRLEKKSI